MTTNVRDHILQKFRREGAPPSLQSVAVELGISDRQLDHMLKSTLKFKNLAALTPEQAYELIAAYGEGLFFESEIEALVQQFHATRRRIAEFEHRTKTPDW